MFRLNEIKKLHLTVPVLEYSDCMVLSARHYSILYNTDPPDRAAATKSPDVVSQLLDQGAGLTAPDLDCTTARHGHYHQTGH